jgi:hypothetical protein
MLPLLFHGLGFCVKVLNVFCLEHYALNLNNFLKRHMSTPENLKQRFVAIASKRELLVELSLKNNLGSLTIDVIQALEELDDLLIEIRKIFPDWQID